MQRQSKYKEKDLFQPGCVSSCVKRSLLRHITRIAEGLIHFLSLVCLFNLFIPCFAFLCICFFSSSFSMLCNVLIYFEVSKLQIQNLYRLVFAQWVFIKS